jgi:hypothetical protein
MTATFDNVTDLATFCAQLAREGITFEVTETSAAGRYRVVLTGGF